MIPYFQFTAFQIGPASIKVWGLLVSLGILLSVFLLRKEIKNWPENRRAKIWDLFFWLIFSGLIGARVFHVFFYESDSFLADPISFFKVWKGGLSSFGGIFGAIAIFLFFWKKEKDKKIFSAKTADIFFVAGLWGWMVGRLGCVSIHDHWGIRSDHWLAWQTPEGPRLEMAFLEILFLLPLALAFFFLRKKEWPDGFRFFAGAVYYGILRFVLDFFRAKDIAGADTRFLGLTPAQYFGIICFVLGVAFIIRILKKNKNGEVA